MTTTHSGPLPGYETTFITRAELSDEGLKTLNERLAGVITSFKGEIVLTEDWGKRKLAYPITKETRGHYTYIVYSGTPGVVAEFERNLRLHEHVLRFLSVNLADEFDAEKFRKYRADLHAATKRREEEREARREEREAQRRMEYGDREDRGERHHHRRDDSGEGQSE
jgi:small subunit ribosomal protein S6